MFIYYFLLIIKKYILSIIWYLYINYIIYARS